MDTAHHTNEEPLPTTKSPATMMRYAAGLWLLPTAVLVLVGWLSMPSCRPDGLESVLLPMAGAASSSVVPIISSSIPQATTTAVDTERRPNFTLIDKALAVAIRDCTTNASAPHECLVVHDAVVDANGTIFYPAEDARNAGLTGLLNRYRRHRGAQRRAARVQKLPFPLREMTEGQRAAWLPAINASSAASRNTSTATVGYYQLPVHWYENVWHTLVQQLFTILHTVAPLVSEGIQVEWVTDIPSHQVRTACKTAAQCRQRPLFQPFEHLFSTVAFFRDDFARLSEPRRHYARLLVGVNRACSPETNTSMAHPQCVPVLERYRRLVLEGSGHPTERHVTESERRCPRTVVVSRQHLRYRKLYPFDKIVARLRESYRARGCNDTELVHVVAPMGSMSLREQLSHFVNATVLVAARGAVSSFSAFVAKGGGLLSLSWAGDQWQPYQALSPSWGVVEHVPVQLVHHDDPKRRPAHGSRRRADTNWCGYKVNPDEVVKHFWRLVGRLPPWPVPAHNHNNTVVARR